MNKAQQKTIEHDLNPILVLTNTKSNKTKIITQHITELIRKNMSARSILTVTFTNKTTTEMREHIIQLTNTRTSKDLLNYTFHQFNLKILSQKTKTLNLHHKNFAIFDHDDCLGMLRDTIQNLITDRHYDLSAILNQISMTKNTFVTPEQYEQHTTQHKNPYNKITKLIYNHYQKTLHNLQTFNFNNLVCEPIHL